LVRAIAAALRAPAISVVASGMIVGLMVFDNAAWFAWAVVSEHRGNYSYGQTLDTEEWAIIEIFRKPRYAGYLVVSQSPKLGYLATVYSPLRSWYSHALNVPYTWSRKEELDRFFANGSEPSAWRNRSLLVVKQHDEATTTRFEASGFRTILSGEQFTVLTRSSHR
jgi:hypothetical protein